MQIRLNISLILFPYVNKAPLWVFKCKPMLNKFAPENHDFACFLPLL